ncbi:potassium channel AKT1-like isoform X2 [Prosopis cineraria]|uniref:potassium channel AKT1-like isoform X2 n=1 Tax=Prosopis cineraria TaxID=364024 RepID=UPI0024107939|nr:potassium channel AKT1-like isoform X2 [Prosopis cineraria]
MPVHQKTKNPFAHSIFCGRGDEQEIELEHMSRDEGSHYSLVGAPLPSLGATAARTIRRPKLRSCIISPFNPRYRCWETFLVLLVFYTAWVCPFEFGFLDESKGPLAITDNVVNGFFAIDIVLTFFVAYLDKSSYLFIDNPRLIALRYAKTWLIFDVISTIPFELARKVLPTLLQTYGLFNMLRLWRLRRVSALFARLEKDRNFNYIWVRCSKLICVTMFSVHFAACFFYFLAANHDIKTTWFGLVANGDQMHLWGHYITSVYWALVTLSTVGYGDLHPVNTKEMTFDIFYIFYILGLNSYLIGNMTNMLVHITSRTRTYRHTVQAATGFAQRNQLPVRLQEQMLAHLFMKYRTDLEGLQHQEVTEMKAEYFPPKEDVILQNEAPTDFYILVTGAAELIIQRNGIEQVVGEAKIGDVVGEIGVLCYRPQLFTVRTKRLSQLLRLNRTAFLNLANANVGDGTIIMSNFLQHLKESSDPMMDGVLAETEAMLARGKMDLPVSPCFAANRDDDLLLHQLLKGGSDPNEADKNGRTSLHIAASRGNEHCVVLLLEYGADPNRKDLNGSIPLWEAMLGGHESVIKLLIDNGGDISCADVGHLACTAVEQNNLELLKEIVRYGGDVTQPKSNGTTALHTAVCDGNTDIVKFLLQHGADIDKPDVHGWTPRALADHQEHEDIVEMFRNIREGKRPLVTPRTMDYTNCLRKFPSEPTTCARKDVTWLENHPRRRANHFHNSFFGIMSAAANRDQANASQDNISVEENLNGFPARVILSCPEKGDHSGKLVFLPKSLQELIDMGVKKFDFLANKILTTEGAQIEDIKLIRDGDHLILARDGAHESMAMANEGR